MAYIEQKLLVSQRMNGEMPHSAVVTGLSNVLYDLQKRENCTGWHRGWDGFDGITAMPADKLYSWLNKVKVEIENPENFRKHLHFKRIKGHWEWDVSHEDIYNEAVKFLDYLILELEPFKKMNVPTEVMR